MGFNDVIDWYPLVLEQVANWKITVLIGDSSFFMGHFPQLCEITRRYQKVIMGIVKLILE